MLRRQRTLNDFVIDPVNMSSDESRIVCSLFQQAAQNGSPTVFKRLQPYSVSAPHPNQKGKFITQYVKFTKTIVPRIHLDHVNGKKTYRYSVVADTIIGSGSFSEVRSVLCTLKPLQNGTVKSKRHKKRVIKKINLAAYIPKMKHLFLKEADIVSKLPYLSGKQLTYDNGFAYLVMNEIEGVNFFNVLGADIGANYKSISLINRLRLSYKLADALIEQVHNNGWVHRDIKHENIHLDRLLNVFLLDFGFVIEEGQCDWATLGSPDFVAPEGLNPARKSSRTEDYYSLGLLLLILWTGQQRNINQQECAEILGLIATRCEVVPKLNIQRLMKLTGLNSSQAQEVNGVIESLMAMEPSQRMDLKLVSATFRKLEIQCLPPPHFSGDVQLFQIASVAGYRLKSTLNSFKKQSMGSQMIPMADSVMTELMSISAINTQDMERAIRIFVDATEIQAFNDVDSKKSLSDRITNIFMDYNFQTGALIALYEYFFDCRHLIEIYFSQFTKLRQEFECLRDELESLINKPNKPKRNQTFDEFVKLTNKYKFEIADIRQKLDWVLRSQSPLLAEYSKIRERLLHLKYQVHEMRQQIADLLLLNSEQVISSCLQVNNEENTTKTLSALEDAVISLEMTASDKLPAQFLPKVSALVHLGIFNNRDAQRIGVIAAQAGHATLNLNRV